VAALHPLDAGVLIGAVRGEWKGCLVAVLVTGLLFGAAVGEAATRASKDSSKPPACSLRGSATVYRDTAARVYTKHNDVYDQDHTYGCLFLADKRVPIETSDSSPGGEYNPVYDLTVRAPFLAYWDWGGIKADIGWSYIGVIDLRTGTKRITGTRRSVLGLGLTPRGSVAWMDTGPSGDTVGYYPPNDTAYVQMLGAGGKDSVLVDSGKDIDQTSFAVGGTRIYWMKGGAPQTATMP
jgi:hypothetical protein